MRDVYFVRHGHTEANEKKLFNPPEIELTEKGILQAKRIEQGCSVFPVDVILTSDYKRAVQTAEIANRLIKKEIIESELLREIRRPSELYNKEQNADGSEKVIDEIHEHSNDPSWHYSDEENFTEFKSRVIKALSMVVNRPEQYVFVVTHSKTLKMIMGLILCGGDLPLDLYLQFDEVLTTSNTGITHASYNDGKWELVTWNDHAHLGLSE